MRLTFTDGTDASPGAVVPAKTGGRTDKMVALGTSEMDLMSNKVLWAKLGSLSRGFQRGAGGWSCGGEKESTRDMLVTCGVSLLTSSGILCLGIYTCHWTVQSLHGKGRSKRLIYSHTAQNQPFSCARTPPAAKCWCVACYRKFNSCIIQSIIPLHNIMNGLYFRLLWELYVTVCMVFACIVYRGALIFLRRLTILQTTAPERSL